MAPEEPVIPIIDLQKCDGCGRCAAACPTGAISCPYEIVWQGDAKDGGPRGGAIWP